MENRIPVILDVDTGVDDAIALLLALGNRKLDVKAVTTVYGNKSLDVTTENTLRLLEFLGRCDIPVAAGASDSFMKKYIVRPPRTDRPNMHGAVGIGDVILPECKQNKLEDMSAVDLMAKVIRESEEPVALVPVGPLTNVATFLFCYPELKEKVKCIAIMGGGAFDGNVNPVVEANISGDPEAAHMVFASGVPVMMGGLDVTMKAYCPKEDRDSFRAIGGPIAEFAADCLIPYAAFYEGIYHHPGPCLHDSVPVAWLIDPDMVKTVPGYVMVDIWGATTYGCTNTDLVGMVKGRMPNTAVGVDIDREAYIELIRDAIRNLTADLAAKA